MRLPSDPSAAGLARAAVRELADVVSASLIERLSLVASELVTNALRHAVAPDPEPSLSLELSPDRVILAVEDRGSYFGSGARDAVPGPDGGFGLRLVDAISDRWWIELGSGTRVVCEFRR